MVILLTLFVVGYLLEGNLDFTLFVQVVAGLITGAYIGAKFTRAFPVEF